MSRTTNERDYGFGDWKTQTLWVYDNEEMVERPVTYALGLYWMLNDMLTDVALRIKNKLEVDIGKVDDAITIFFANKSHAKFSILCKELKLSKNFVPYCKEIIVSKADGNKLHKKVFSRDNKNPQTDSSDHKSKELWVRILLKPDLATYNMTSLNGDIVDLIKKRVIDIAGCLGETVEVKLNGMDVSTNSFSTYVDLYLKPRAFHFVNIPRITMKISDDMEICVTLSTEQFQQVSFVNLVNTSHGGDNVDVVSNAIAKHLFETIKEKDENSTLNSDENENENQNLNLDKDENPNLNSDEDENPNQDSDVVKNHLWIFLNVKFRNPVFNLPAKDTFDHPRHTRAFTKTFELSEDFLKEVVDSQIVNILKRRFGMYEEEENLQVENLTNAYFAGEEHSKDCTLIFVEGNSAESLATTGLGILGRDTFGVFRLQGKLLNVRENSKDNKVIDNIMTSMGVQKNKIYEGEDYADSLRYNKDDDGFHIKGLLINLFHCFCPSLLKIEGFLAEFITPCIKVTKEHDQKYFYSTKSHEEWKKTQDNNASDWSTKHYKGLGTFSPEEEGKDFFRNLENHRKYFVWDDRADEAIDLAFNKKRADDRKWWLNNYIRMELKREWEEQHSNRVNDEDEENHNDEDEETHTNYTDFFNKKYIKYCIAALKRTIPSIVDGLKPGQRKILFSALKNKLIGITKLEAFSKFVDHHSSSNVASITMGMTQNYVGSNNVNLFIPHGNYGTRGRGGEDQSAPRYLHIELSPITRLIFPDDESSDQQGKEVKPGRYFPIIPMVLVNGCEGIGVGWNTSVPNYHPIHIIKNMMHLIDSKGNVDKLPVEMRPWYKGFHGRIEGSQSSDGDYTSYGCIQESNGMLKITELPILKWTDKYLKFLNSVNEHNAEAKNPFIKGYKKYGDDTSPIDIRVKLSGKQLMEAKQEGLEKKFKLEKKLKTSNMVLFQKDNSLKLYRTPQEILVEFYKIGMEQYQTRLNNLRNKKAAEVSKLRSELDFVKRYREGNIILSNDHMQKNVDLLEYIKHQGFEDNPENLASLKLVSLTKESETALEKELAKMEEELNKVKKKAAATVWIEDLQVLENELLKDKFFRLTD